MEGAKQGKRQLCGRQLEGYMVLWPVAFKTYGGWVDDAALICRRIASASIFACNQGNNGGQQIKNLKMGGHGHTEG